MQIITSVKASYCIPKMTMTKMTISDIIYISWLFCLEVIWLQSITNNNFLRVESCHATAHCIETYQQPLALMELTLYSRDHCYVSQMITDYENVMLYRFVYCFCSRYRTPYRFVYCFLFVPDTFKRLSSMRK